MLSDQRDELPWDILRGNTSSERPNQDLATGQADFESPDDAVC